MGTFLAVVSILGFPVLAVLAIISIFKKNGKAKRYGKGMIGTVVLLIIAAAISPEATNKSNTENNSVATTQADNKAVASKPVSNTVNANVKVEEDKTTGILKVHYINVGQADSILIQQNGYNMLIDAGNNGDSNLVVSYLKSQGVSKLDYVIGTHPHEDHIGGLDVVINTFDIGKIFMPKKTSTTQTYKDVITAIKNKDLKITAPVPGTTYDLGEAKWTILAPGKDKDYEDVNNYSIVQKLKFGNTSFIFDGDAAAISEMEIVKGGADIKADVLKVGHHGSSTSTCASFLDAVNPKYAVVSVGKGNSYGHPESSTMNRLQSKGVQVFRTDESGTIVATSDGKDIKFNCNPGTYKTGDIKPNSSNVQTPKPSNNNSNNKSNSTNKAAVSKPVPKVVPVPQNKEQTVYITNTGSKYHRDGCQYLRKSQIPIKKSEAIDSGYSACSRCSP